MMEGNLFFPETELPEMLPLEWIPVIFITMQGWELLPPAYPQWQVKEMSAGSFWGSTAHPVPKPGIGIFMNITLNRKKGFIG